MTPGKPSPSHVHGCWVFNAVFNWVCVHFIVRRIGEDDFFQASDLISRRNSLTRLMALTDGRPRRSLFLCHSTNYKQTKQR